MKRYRQFQPLVVSDFECDSWKHPLHNHTHYELIFIKRGSGFHLINDVENRYRAGDVFLLGPDDHHFFRIAETSRFVYLKFTDMYLYKDESAGKAGIQQLEYLIKSRETHKAGFALGRNDKAIINRMFDVVIAMKNDMLLNEQLLWTLLLMIVSVLQRNMNELKPAANRNKDMQAIFCYLHKNIYSPDLLRAEILAPHFNTTSDYIGPYFKRNTGITLREYIRDYRAALIRQRMAGQKYTMKEIAAEFGLTDQSHIAKILKSGGPTY
jgi:AraC-like DNA-binding protein